MGSEPEQPRPLVPRSEEGELLPQRGPSTGDELRRTNSHALAEAPHDLGATRAAAPKDRAALCPPGESSAYDVGDRGQHVHRLDVTVSGHSCVLTGALGAQ